MEVSAGAYKVALGHDRTRQDTRQEEDTTDTTRASYAYVVMRQMVKTVVAFSWYLTEILRN